jgi:hypothetical protein
MTPCDLSAPGATPLNIVAAVECAVLMRKMMAERNAALPEDKRILHRISVNLRDALKLERRKKVGSHARFHARAH